MADPQQATSVQEALTHVKTWLASGEKEKAKQGLREILEFDPVNAEAKKMLDDLEKSPLQGPAPTPSATMPKPGDTFQMPTQTPVAAPAPKPMAAAPVNAPTPMKLEPAKEPPKMMTIEPKPMISTPTPMPKMAPAPAQTPSQISMSMPAPTAKPMAQAPMMEMAPDAKKEKMKKIATLAISILILAVGGYFLLHFFFGNSTPTPVDTQTAPETSVSMEQTAPSQDAVSTDVPADTTTDKVKRR